MPYLIAVIIALALFIGFLLLTLAEGRRGSRFLAGPRYRLDQKVARAFFIAEHVDWSAFSAHLTRTTVTTLAHDIAQGTLTAVRVTERFLTRAVRSLRTRRDSATLPAPRSMDIVRTTKTRPRAKVQEPKAAPAQDRASEAETPV